MAMQDEHNLTVSLDEDRLRKLNTAYDRELTLSRFSKGKEAEHNGKGNDDDRAFSLETGGGFMMDAGTMGGGFMADDTTYSTELNKDADEEDVDAIHVDRVPAIFETLEIPCDDQVLDVLHDAIDKNGLVSRRRFLQIAGALLDDNSGIMEPDNYVEAKSGKGRRRSRRQAQARTSTEEQDSESDEESVDEYKPDRDDVEIESDEEDMEPSLSAASEEELLAPSTKRKAKMLDIESTSNLPSDYISTKLFNLFKPTIHHGSAEPVISLEELRHVYLMLNEKGTEEEMVELLTFASSNGQSKVTLENFKRLLVKLEIM